MQARTRSPAWRGAQEVANLIGTAAGGKAGGKAAAGVHALAKASFDQGRSRRHGTRRGRCDCTRARWGVRLGGRLRGSKFDQCRSKRHGKRRDRCKYTRARQGGRCGGCSRGSKNSISAAARGTLMRACAEHVLKRVRAARPLMRALATPRPLEAAPATAAAQTPNDARNAKAARGSGGKGGGGEPCADSRGKGAQSAEAARGGGAERGSGVRPSAEGARGKHRERRSCSRRCRSRQRRGKRRRQPARRWRPKNDGSSRPPRTWPLEAAVTLDVVRARTVHSCRLHDKCARGERAAEGCLMVARLPPSRELPQV